MRNNIFTAIFLSISFYITAQVDIDYTTTLYCSEENKGTITDIESMTPTNFLKKYK